MTGRRQRSPISGDMDRRRRFIVLASLSTSGVWLLENDAGMWSLENSSDHWLLEG